MAEVLRTSCERYGNSRTDRVTHQRKYDEVEY